ncbi:spore germination protein PD [Bacillus ectoiniformans]|uniref:spore gernimation protein GerPD n=1 Tax=Bacillus ectoiniformans TaxID=1494429 RepID=UPI00195CDD93|nr:spore gernimation protein GerPD [Bacillus ectoiniformans]MBM7647578.1 spore germination protein PD [Bacillus ectoiniformans]
MKIQIINRELAVGEITITGVSSSSCLQIGDTHLIEMHSTFDTPPEALIIGPFVPLGPES